MEIKAVNLENRVRFTGELLQLRTFGVKPKYSAPCNQEGMLVELCDYKNVIHPEDDRYFYHPDHLGSSSWITGTDGTPVQHLSYLPFGEEFVDQKTSNWSAAHKFSGKEKDEETGYNYFHARYYDPNTSIFLSVNPLSDKYPSHSPYVYCLNNPIKLVDPDGREVFITGSEAEAATKKLSTENIIITRDADKGKLDFEGKAKTRNERLLVRAIKSEKVSINLTAEKENSIPNGGGEDIIADGAGAFLGNTLIYNEKGKPKRAATNQFISMDRLNKLYREKDHGGLIAHEITESFKGGLISIRTKKEASSSFLDIANPIYNKAHRRASSQPIPKANIPTLPQSIINAIRDVHKQYK